MRLSSITKIGAIAAVLLSAGVATVPASADTYRGYFSDKAPAMTVQVRYDRNDHRFIPRRDYRRELLLREMQQHRHARFHHYGWEWQHNDHDGFRR